MKRPEPPLEPLDVTDDERRTLESWVRRRKTAQEAKDAALRAQIVLASTRPGDDGHPVSPRTVAGRLQIPYETAAKWRSRFVEARLSGLTGPDVPYVPDAPAEGTPQRTAPPKPVAEPFDLDGSYDVVGLYLAPPERAVALCVDSDAARPPRQGTDTTALLTALDATTGMSIGSLHRRHRAVEFRRFLTTVDKQVPGDLPVHLLCDNQAAHRAPTVKNWLLAHPRFRLHFTPAGASWPALVDRWSVTAPDDREIRAWTDSGAEEPYVWTGNRTGKK
ncbi:hypothetical protein [Streptomyces hypolithicus]